MCAASKKSESVNAILLDIDGTLTFKDEAIPGASAALQTLRSSGYKLRFLTNITGRTPYVIAQQLEQLGIFVSADEIQTAATACVDFLLSQTSKKSFLVIPDSVRTMFAEVPVDADAPDYVVIGDIGEDFNYHLLNRVFNYLDQGAELIALQRNLFWFDGAQKRLDCGAFIVGLEAATQKQAFVTGKPAEHFFKSSLQVLKVAPEETIIVGDDVLTDIAGANRCSMRSVLVGTGKFKSEHLGSPFGGHTWFLPSVAALPALLEDLS